MDQTINLGVTINITQALSMFQSLVKGAETSAAKSGSFFQKLLPFVNLDKTKMTDGINKQLKDSLDLYSTGMKEIEKYTKEGLDKLDALWKGSVKNQKTVLFSLLSELSSTMKSSLENMIAANDGFIASNLKTGAAAVVSAIGSALSWLVGVLGPFGIAAAAGVTAGIIALWNGAKKSLGFAQGGIAGFGLVGENGPEVVAPMKDFSSMVSDLVTMTQKTLLSNMNALSSGGGNMQTLTALNSIKEQLAKNNTAVMNSKLNVNIKGEAESTTKLSGAAIEMAQRRSYNHIAAVTA